MTTIECNKKDKIYLKPAIKIFFTYIGFMVVNIYADKKLDLDNFLNDYPDFTLGRIMIIFIKWFFPLLFVIVGIFASIYSDRFFERAKLPRETSTKKFLVIIGQVLVSIGFFYMVWRILFYTHGYPSPLDQSLFMDAFLAYCLMTFLTLGMLASDEVKQLVEYIIKKLY